MKGGKRQRYMTLGRAVLATVVPGVLIAVAVARPAHADDDWDILNNTPGHRPPSMERYERPADREESGHWWRREPPPAVRLPPAVHFPGLPPPPQIRRRRTKEGRLTLEDLGLASDKSGSLRGQRPGYDFQIAPDGDITFSDHPAIQVEGFYFFGIVAIFGTFDVTDWLMRRNGDDPYWYDKDQVRRLTQEMRAQLERRHRTKRVRLAEAELPARLQTLWQRRDLSPETRRRLLFSLWDELLDVPDATDPESLSAERARSIIVEFVRRHLPAGSDDAFSPTELAALNAGRRSRHPFAP